MTVARADRGENPHPVTGFAQSRQSAPAGESRESLDTTFLADAASRLMRAVRDECDGARGALLDVFESLGVAHLWRGHLWQLAYDVCGADPYHLHWWDIDKNDVLSRLRQEVDILWRAGALNPEISV